MNTLSSQINPPAPVHSNLGAKLLNVLVSPSLVFDEISTRAPQLANWLVPTVLVCLTGVLALGATTNPDQTTAAIHNLVAAGAVTRVAAAELTAHWRLISSLAVCLSSLLGVLWAAFVIWLIGRVFLRSPIEYRRALEVAGLSSSILVLGTITTWLLALATGDALARPSLSLVMFRFDPFTRGGEVCASLNFFYLWNAAALAIGLARLSNVRTREAGFWVFGYWVVARLGLVLLA